MFESKVFEEQFPNVDFLRVNYGENIELINIAIPKGAYCGLYVFLQSTQRRKKQHYFIERLRANNYCSCICFSFEDFLNTVKEYLRGKDWTNFQRDLNECIAKKYKTSK